MPKIGIILSGCGVLDGSEIHESVIAMLCLDQQGAAYQCMAPDKTFQVVDHRTRQPVPGETRNVLTEAARIARGNILSLTQVKGKEYDGFILPGGYGAAKNLSTFATDGAHCEADPQVTRVLVEAHKAGRPIGLICIAPAVGARIFGQTLHPTLTIGYDKSTAASLEKMGARHSACGVHEFCVDEANRIVSTPAYMEAKTIKDVYVGVNRLVERLLAMIQSPVAVG